MKTFKYYTILAILSGLLLGLSWPPHRLTTPAIFFAFVPLLYIAHSSHKTHIFIFFSFLSVCLWNIITIWWITKSTLVGGIFTIIANSCLMLIPLWGFYKLYKHHVLIGYLAFIVFWLAFEYFHFNWECNFPWLSLGHVFATHSYWIQWYQYTGVAGGTLWVLLSNIIIFHHIQHYKISNTLSSTITSVISISFVLLLPIIWSSHLYHKYKQTLKTAPVSHHNIIAIQPNIECYSEKFSIPEQLQLDNLIHLSQQGIDAHTDIILWPETAFQNALWENISLYNQGNKSKSHITHWLKSFPHIALITGLNTYRQVKKNKRNTAIRQWFRGQDTIHYIIYNSAGLFYQDTIIDYYHKSKLVPGVEMMPYAKYLQFMNAFILDIGGTSGTLGTDSIAHNLYPPSTTYPIASLICYESIYGAYVADFVSKGASLLCISTNDGWWGNTDGYQQHAQYGLLRAIETRRYIIRSANTGISYIANPLGEIEQSLPWNQKGILKHQLSPQYEYTFYVKHKDYLYIMSYYLSIGLLMLHIYLLRIKK